jgi:hypothetical protein
LHNDLTVDPNPTATVAASTNATSTQTAINARITAANSAASLGDAAALGMPKFSSPSLSGNEVDHALGLSGSATCTDGLQMKMIGNTINLPVCQFLVGLKDILYWAMNAFVALYAWSKWARRNN